VGPLRLVGGAILVASVGLAGCAGAAPATCPGNGGGIACLRILFTGGMNPDTVRILARAAATLVLDDPAEWGLS
jgi:hypothetical protein